MYYQRLNAVTGQDAYPLPKIDESLDALTGRRFFCSQPYIWLLVGPTQFWSSRKICFCHQRWALKLESAPFWTYLCACGVPASYGENLSWVAPECTAALPGWCYSNQLYIWVTLWLIVLGIWLIEESKPHVKTKQVCIIQDTVKYLGHVVSELCQLILTNLLLYPHGLLPQIWARWNHCWVMWDTSNS